MSFLSAVETDGRYPLTDTEKEANPRTGDANSQPPPTHEGYLIIDLEATCWYENCKHYGRADELSKTLPRTIVVRAGWVRKRHGILPRVGA